MMNLFKEGGLGGLLEQAQKMREELARIQEEAAKKNLEVTAGGGMVKVVINGKQQVQSITLDPELMKMQDQQMLQDVIRAGVNQAISESQKMVAEEMGKVTGGLGQLASFLKGI